MNLNPNRDIVSYTKEYNSNKFEVIQAIYRKKKILEEISKLGQNLRILELGCGLDSIFNHLTSFKTFHVVEPSSDFYETAIKDKERHQLKNQIHLCNDYAENFKPNTDCFDLILVSGLLHELPNPTSVLETVYNLSSTNTIIHINVPNANSFHRLWALKSNLIQSKEELSPTQINYQQFRTFSLETLTDLVLSNNFNIISKGSYFIKPFTHSQMQELLDREIINEQHLNGLYNLIEFFPENGSEIFVNVKKQ